MPFSYLNDPAPGSSSSSARSSDAAFVHAHAHAQTPSGTFANGGDTATSSSYSPSSSYISDFAQAASLSAYGGLFSPYDLGFQSPGLKDLRGGREP